MESQVAVKCSVKVRAELPINKSGTVRLRVLEGHHSHPSGNYLDAEKGCEAQFKARGEVGNLALPVKDSLKSAFSMYKEANTTASYGKLANLSLTK